MKEIDISFPDLVNISKGKLNIDVQKPVLNIIKINNTDYYPYYLDNKYPGNKGGNSFVIKLVKAQDYDEDEGYPEFPDMVMKICKFRIGQIEINRSLRFKNEIEALLDCNNNGIQNLVQVRNYGKVQILSEKWKSTFRFYTMEYADSDMISYLEKNSLSIFDKIDLCIEICESLRKLWSLGYYHRDIKPDNILFLNKMWMISDLGLVSHREKDDKADLGEKWIGPRGWMSPESMNKFLTESTRFETYFDCKIDHQSDIYQLGKVLWYILQGNSPEGGIRRNDFILNSDEVYQIIRTMLNNSKKRRYQDIEHVIVNLKRIHTRMIISGNEVSL